MATLRATSTLVGWQTHRKRVSSQRIQTQKGTSLRVGCWLELSFFVLSVCQCANHSMIVSSQLRLQVDVGTVVSSVI